MENTLTRKSYGAIYVKDPDHIDRVKEIIKEMDEYEYGYLPDDLIKPFSDYPEVAYVHKFDALDMDALTAKCWAKGVYIWVFDARTEFPRNALKENESKIF